MERRVFKRIRDGVKVIYKVLEMKREKEVSPIDIGGGGVRLSLKEKLAPSTVLELMLILPDEDHPFYSVGEVIWQRYDATRGQYETGIKFVRMNLEDRRRLIRFVHSKAQ